MRLSFDLSLCRLSRPLLPGAPPVLDTLPTPTLSLVNASGDPPRLSVTGLVDDDVVGLDWYYEVGNVLDPEGAATPDFTRGPDGAPIEYTILVEGDSKVAPVDSFARQYTRTNYVTINRAIGGTVFEQNVNPSYFNSLKLRLDEALFLKPDRMILSVGTNDGYTGPTGANDTEIGASYYTQLRDEYIAPLRAIGVDVVLCAPLPIENETSSETDRRLGFHNAALADEGTGFEAYVNFLANANLATWSGTYFGDSVHLNATGNTEALGVLTPVMNTLLDTFEPLAPKVMVGRRMITYDDFNTGMDLFDIQGIYPSGVKMAHRIRVAADQDADGNLDWLGDPSNVVVSDAITSVTLALATVDGVDRSQWVNTTGSPALSFSGDDTGGNFGVRALPKIQNDLAQFEMTPTALNATGIAFGVIDNLSDLNDGSGVRPGIDVPGLYHELFGNGSAIYTDKPGVQTNLANTFVLGDTVGMRINLTTHAFELYVWHEDVGGSPLLEIVYSNTIPVAQRPANGDYYPWFSPRGSSSTSATVNFGGTAFKRALDNGYSGAQ